jgi:hypothetical protein
VGAGLARVAGAGGCGAARGGLCWWELGVTGTGSWESLVARSSSRTHSAHLPTLSPYHCFNSWTLLFVQELGATFEKTDSPAHSPSSPPPCSPSSLPAPAGAGGHL